MLSMNSIKEIYNLKIVTIIGLLPITLVGTPVIVDGNIAIAQSNISQNASSNADVEKWAAVNLTNLKSAAKITSYEAIQIALKNASAQKSNVKGVELERENGNVVYSINLVQGNESKDIKVDVVKGKILEIKNGDIEKEGNSDDGYEEGDYIGDNDTAEYENSINNYNSTEMLAKFL